MRSYDASSSAGDQFFVHDTKTWNVVWSLHTAPFIPKTLSLSPNGKSVVLGGMSHGASNTTSDLVTLDLQNHGIERRMTAFAADQTPHLVLWSPDGARILAVSIDGSETPGAPCLTTLDASSGQKTALESNAAAGVKSPVFAGNGKYLIEGGEHLPVTIWNSMHTTKLQEIPIQPARLAVSRDGRYLAVVRLSKISVWQLD
jgi:WD40 repeat protein